tara:strand:+ start:713 stop:1069 length:357 start_codon:yes stop_codon:yes gene_type:complete
MAHYAFLNNNNIVTEVIVGKDETDTTHNWEEFYGEIRNQVCRRTSYNSNIRGNYAGIGYTYDTDNDVFYAHQPYESWTLNTDSWQWVCPLTYPNDGNMYYWDEDIYQADNTKGWVLNG